ncbi:putative ADP-ribosylation factor GTPase-activating protein 1 [Operophtera brumata]|uniref:Putative ADP-ribosylation factor GTPase-activating protein 1 n=1 Tax=Operophtera brumata TaxID=104452 RepID=A0A0L7K4H8_OPEBR|nr:putative ADP-ribosylation factor GTPase-activating protein 1 [Operophtera brumata]
MATTVTEKVNSRSGWNALGGSTDTRRASNNSTAPYQAQGYGAMKSSTSEPYSQCRSGWNALGGSTDTRRASNNSAAPYQAQGYGAMKKSVTTRNLDSRDLSRAGVDSRDMSRAGVASPPLDVKEIRVQKQEESWDWLNN